MVLGVVSSRVGVKFYQYSGWRFLPVLPSYTITSTSSNPFGVGVTSLASITWNSVVVVGEFVYMLVCMSVWYV